MRNTADATGGTPIAVWSQSISGGEAVNPLVTFYDIHERVSRTAHETIITDFLLVSTTKIYRNESQLQCVWLMTLLYRVHDTINSIYKKNLVSAC
jgi:hypothetical protein